MCIIGRGSKLHYFIIESPDEMLRLIPINPHKRNKSGRSNFEYIFEYAKHLTEWTGVIIKDYRTPPTQRAVLGTGARKRNK